MLFPHPNVLWKECVLALILATLAPSDQTSQPVGFQCIEQKPQHHPRPTTNQRNSFAFLDTTGVEPFWIGGGNDEKIGCLFLSEQQRQRHRRQLLTFDCTIGDFKQQSKRENI